MHSSPPNLKIFDKTRRVLMEFGNNEVLGVFEEWPRTSTVSGGGLSISFPSELTMLISAIMT